DPDVVPWAISIAGALAAVAIVIAVRPDPRDLAHAEEDVPGSTTTPLRTERELIGVPAFRGAVIAVAVSQMAMVGVMGVTPNALTHLGHGGDVPLVISLHIAGMFAFAPLVGWLLDRWGRRAGLILGLGLTAAGALIAASQISSRVIGGGLLVIGLGWSATYLAVTAVISDVTHADERAGALGFTDLLVLACSAAAALIGGLILEVAGYGSLGVAAAILATLGLLIVAGIRMPRPTPVAARS
ncbi:MAG: MFS transporter, partial [Actinomycetota bacterium]